MHTSINRNGCSSIRNRSRSRDRIVSYRTHGGRERVISKMGGTIDGIRSTRTKTSLNTRTSGL